MKVPNFLCCASLAFVNEMISMSGCGGMMKRRGSYTQYQSRISSSRGDDEHNRHATGIRNSNLHDHSLHRRALVEKLAYSFVSSLVLLTNVKSAHAACLSGDIRPDCIGVYKLPIDAAESPYVNTPEKLKLYAPDLRWVPPTPYPRTYGEALNQLKDQRQQLDAAQDLVARGDIEKAGLALLEVIPKVSAAGIVIIRMFDDASNSERNLAMKLNRSESIGNDGNPSSSVKATALEMKAYRIKYTLNELLGYLGETDVLIGQGLRGDLGAPAPAQIQILNSFSDCRKEYDNLLGTVPEKLALV